MTDLPLKALLESAKSQLQQARNQPRDASVQSRIVLAYGLELLARLLDGVQSGLEDGELVEVALVYDTLATETARLFTLAVPEAFRALVELCDDTRARRLLAGQPAASPDVLDLLRRRLIWLTVTYEWPAAGPRRRVVEIVHRTPQGALLSCDVAQAVSWQDLPDRVRSRLLAGTGQAVRYQLYPDSARTGAVEEKGKPR
ncbi:hypothetical protein [Streptomyces sp. NBC_01477]|uniref:hypothetical protein n=1 Tax=Streptomyces sp. NBC_01477 TaxID=2976015 RepID=UPI002E37A594|nr:hypothetical protein [Streptomyces sp. NBC_01477]